MQGRRILLFSLFFSILAGSLIYYVFLPRSVDHPLRIDAIPADAYVIPWMQPNPTISTLNSLMSPWNVDAVMAGALRLDMVFNITTDNQTRVVPSSVYLGHDLDYLYVGGKFQQMFTNPASGSNLTLPNYLNILFDVDNDGKLESPESGCRLSVLVYEDEWKTSGWYRDLVWVNYSSYFHRAIWMFGDQYKPGSSVAGVEAAAEYDNSSGTLTILFSRHLRLSEIADINALQIRPGERWVMSFVLELGYATWYGDLSDFVDGWPRNIYPYLSNDSLWWPKLVIDLTNPPPSF
jgi:hypothetical protein